MHVGCLFQSDSTRYDDERWGGGYLPRYNCRTRERVESLIQNVGHNLLVLITLQWWRMTYLVIQIIFFRVEPPDCGHLSCHECAYAMALMTSHMYTKTNILTFRLIYLNIKHWSNRELRTELKDCLN